MLTTSRLLALSMPAQALSDYDGQRLKWLCRPLQVLGNCLNLVVIDINRLK